MTTLDLEPIKERLAEATPGPWFADDDGGVSTEPHACTMTSTPIVDTEGCGMGNPKDATFIANAPSDIAALVAEVERLRGQIDAARALHKPLDALNTNSNRIGQVCLGCGQDNGNWNEWPCPTIRALEVGE